MTDIIDTIDALIEQQLAEGEPHGGFDAGDPNFPTCPHCDRDWHGFPLTERVEAMRHDGSFDEGYRVRDDDSTVLCPGSDRYGPARPEAISRRLSIATLANFLGLSHQYANGNLVIYNLSVDLDPEDWA